MEHLSLEIFDLAGNGSKYANLPEDTSITITDTSEIFASGDVWSLAFTLNVKANADIFGTSGDIHGSRLHEQLNGRRTRLWVEGLPLYLGYLKLDDEVDVDEDGNVDVTFESGQKTFEELIEGGKANQVPMMSDVQIGMALWRKRWTCAQVKLRASVFFRYGDDTECAVAHADITHDVIPTLIGDEDSQLTYFISDGEADGTSVQPYPRMVFPKGSFYNTITGKDETIDCINTDSPYDDNHPYCNTALCYQKYGYTVTTEENGKKYTHDDYSSSPSAERGYEVMPANRVNSAPNFYVIYWLKALMKHLGIYIEENQMMDVEDLRRLFFVNTNCAYEEIQHLRYPYNADLTYGRYQFDDKGPLVSEYMGDLVDEKYDKNIKRWNGPKTITKSEDCGFSCEAFTHGDGEVFSKSGDIDHIIIKVKSVAGMSSSARAFYDGYDDKEGFAGNRSLQRNLLLHKAMATSDCFPNVDISEVIDALKSGFGVRLLFDDNYKRVRVVLLRNIFRDKDVQTINCDIIEETKTENCIRGFRMTYGDSDDTTFYYKGFADMLPHKTELWIDNSDTHDYSKWQLNAEYANLLNKISAFDTTCYVTPNNGNAYGIKVDKDAKKYDELYPSLFEYAGYMDAEDGDCTGEDETIETVNVGFTPAIMNDVNFENERDDATMRQQRFALFVDETMRPRRPDLKDLPDETSQPGVKSYDDANAVYSVDKLYAKHGPKGSDTKMVSDGVVQPGCFSISSDMYVEAAFPELKFKDAFHIGKWGDDYKGMRNTSFTVRNVKITGHINEGYRLYLQDNFEPNDDGICPIETHDWGLTLGIMRGSGSDSYVQYSTDPNDGEENETWDVVPGSTSTAHPDTCDSYGNLFDYNGIAGGVGDTDGRISLKLRAEKPNPYYKKGSTKNEEKNQYLPITNEQLRGRGLCDQFYKEYSYWVRNARIIKRTVHMTLAQFLAIDKTKRVRVGDIIGFIRKMEFTVNNQSGLGNVTMEIMYI